MWVGVALVAACGCRGGREPISDSPATSLPTKPTYSVFSGGLTISNYSGDAPVIWVFSGYTSREKIKAVSGLETKDIEDGNTCLLVVSDSAGRLTEHRIGRHPVDLQKYIGKRQYPISELTTDLTAALK
jgi:hypothetical protein